MYVARYEPLNRISQFREQANRLFQREILRGLPSTAGEPQAPSARPPSTQALSSWTPAVDVREEHERYVINADVPGVDPKDIEITMEDGVLSIKGMRSVELPGNGAQGDDYSRSERMHGGFERRFALPEGADSDAIVATSRHGVLSVSIAKKAATQPRRIEVQ